MQDQTGTGFHGSDRRSFPLASVDPDASPWVIQFRWQCGPSFGFLRPHIVQVFLFDKAQMTYRKFRKAPFALRRSFWYTPNATEGRRRMAQRRAWLVGLLVVGTITFHGMAWAFDTCGDLNEPCCTDGGPPSCNSGLSCALSGTCISGGCGGVGQPCCSIVADFFVFGASGTTDPAVGPGCNPGLVCATAIGPNGTCDPQSRAPAASHFALVAMAALLAGSGLYLTRRRKRA